MNNMDEILFGSKSCFGQYENWDNSWHCKGCPIKEECELKKVENEVQAIQTGLTAPGAEIINRDLELLRGEQK